MNRIRYDQVEGLRQKGIRAEFITGETSSADANAILKRMIGKGDGNEVKMIYVSPSILISRIWTQLTRSRGVHLRNSTSLRLLCQIYRKPTMLEN